MISVLCVTFAGMAAAWVAGDILPSVLVVQVQTWRATWLLSVFAATSLALCSGELWRRGSASRVVLGLLALAWLSATEPAIAVPASGLALLMYVFERSRTPQIQPKILLLTWTPFIVITVIAAGLTFNVVITIIEAKSEDAHLSLTMIRLLKLYPLPAVLLTALWVNSTRWTWDLSWRTCTTAALVLAVVTLWDDRSALQRAIDSGNQDQQLVQAIAGRPGEVLWLDGGYSTWTLAGRPNWVHSMQGASTVFSRTLSIEWDRRVQQLIDLGLADNRLRGSSELHPTNRAPRVSRDALAPLCRSSRAPSWVIAPIDDVQSGGAITWRAPDPMFNMIVDENGANWKRTQRYAIFECFRQN
jgi:hypothetical protein